MQLISEVNQFFLIAKLLLNMRFKTYFLIPAFVLQYHCCSAFRSSSYPEDLFFGIYYQILLKIKLPSNYFLDILEPHNGSISTSFCIISLKKFCPSSYYYTYKNLLFTTNHKWIEVVVLFHGYGRESDIFYILGKKILGSIFTITAIDVPFHGRNGMEKRWNYFKPEYLQNLPATRAPV